QDHAVLRHHGVPEPPGDLVVETGARCEHAPVALHPLELLEQRDQLGDVLGAGLPDLHRPPLPPRPPLRLTTRAGAPTATEYGGISPFTKVCAPTTEPRPTRDPRRIDAFS